MEVMPLWQKGMLGLSIFLALGCLVARHNVWRLRSRPLSLGVLFGAALASGGPAYLTMSIFLAFLGEGARLWSGRAGRLYAVSSYALVPVLMILLLRSSGADPPWEAFGTAPVWATIVVALTMSVELWLVPFTGLWSWIVRVFAVLIMGMVLMALTMNTLLLGLGIMLLGVSFLVLGAARFRVADHLRAKFWLSESAWVSFVSALVLVFIGTVRL